MIGKFTRARVKTILVAVWTIGVGDGAAEGVGFRLTKPVEVIPIVGESVGKAESKGGMVAGGRSIARRYRVLNQADASKKAPGR